MLPIRLLISVFLVVPFLAHAESNYWDHIQELSKQSTPQGNPQLEAYLKSLTPSEMLQAARQYSQYAEKKFSEANWEQALVDVDLALAFYGTAQGGLADERLNELLKCVAGENEGRFFRESLVRLLRQRYWRRLTHDQRMQCRQKFFAVLSDKKEPARLRALSCRELSLAIAENHRDIITADKNVKPLRNDKQKWWNLDDLVRKGEVRLDPDTRKSLKSLRDEIANVTPTLTALSQDAAESPEVKDRVQAALKTFADLPVAPEQ